MTEHDAHLRFQELLGAHALDATEPDESAALEGHLAACPRCRDEVDAGREVAGRLATSARVEDAGPLPPGLWDRIAGDLASSPRRVPGPMPGLGAPPERGGAEVIDLSAARRPWRAARLATLAVAAAAVAAIAVLGVDLSSTDHRLGQAQKELSGRGDAAAIAAAMATPAHRLVRLDSAEGVTLAEFVVRADGQGYLVRSSMPALPSDETYQLWAIVSGQPISVGLLGDHPAQASFTLASAAPASELAVTVEPAGGVTTPDRRPVASGRPT
jgi:hypothetical protein